MSDLLWSGALSAVGFYVVLAQLDLKKVCGYHLWFDVFFSALLLVLYRGTFSGMVTAFAGGVTLTLLLWLTRGLIGFKTWNWRRGWTAHGGW